jgi:hypothetical protein
MLHLRLSLAAAVLLLPGCFVPVATTARTSDPVTEDPVPGRPRIDANAVVPITYDDLNIESLQPDTLFENWMLTQRVRDLDGKRVRISGFMCGGTIFSNTNIKQFVLLREKECPFGRGGQAHHAIAVSLQGSPATFTANELTIEGVLSVRPFTGENGCTWSLYAIDAATLR